MRSATSSCSAARSPGAGSASRWMCRSRSKPGSSSQLRHADAEARLDDAPVEAREALDEALAHDRAGALDVERLVEPQHGR